MSEPNYDNVRAEIDPMGSMTDMLVLLSEGNPGALSAIVSFKDDPDLPLIALFLDDMNMRGSQIWVAFKYACDSDPAELKRRVMERDHTLVQFVNDFRGCGPWIAVVAGASVVGRQRRSEEP